MRKFKTGIQNSLNSIFNLVEIAAYFACAATLVGFLPVSVLPFELFCHFRVQYLVLLVLSLVPFLVLRRWVPAVILLIGITANLAEIVPLYSHSSQDAGPSRQTLNLVDINFNSRNINFDLLKSLLKQTDADVVCWQEFSPAAEDWARKNLLDYPYSKQIPRRNNFGIAIFSKIPVSNFKVEYFTDVNIETIVATIQLGVKPLQIICTHTYPPIDFDSLHTRDLQLKNLAAFVKGGPPTILCGDLNTTSWSSSFKGLLSESGLTDSRQGFGVQSSWPTCLVPMMIPIDHVLVDQHIKVLDRRIGSDVKSDHFPVILKLAI